ncbi:hypothetical protein T492DRAFT_1036447 [Pavlovales sp. CCMP2436]|nr:hypothetical protein T492DRAFT_1036447 [Pavlovales sp. CCMP2436]
MIQTFEEARRMRRHQQQSLCPSLPLFFSTPRIAISLASGLSLIGSLTAMGLLGPSVGRSTCTTDSGDWLPGYDPFGAAVSVCVAAFLMSLLGLASVVSTSINTLIAFAVVQVPVFSCLMPAAGMLLTFPEQAKELFLEYRACAPATQLQAACLSASEKPNGLGAMLLVLSLLLVWSYAEVSRVIGFTGFITRFMVIVNIASAVAGVGVLGVGVLLLGAQSSTPAEQSAEMAQVVPEWAPALLLAGGIVMLLLSALAFLGVSQQLEKVLYAHVALSIGVCLMFTVGSARQSAHMSDLTGLAAEHRLSVACCTVLVVLLLILNVSGSIHLLVEIRRQGLTFTELVQTSDYSMHLKMRNHFGTPLPIGNPLLGRAGGGRSGAVASQGTRGGPPAIPEFTLELEDSNERYHSTINSNAFFSGGRGGQ